MKVKVAESHGAALDWAVAKCEDLHTGIDGFWSTAVLEQEENPYKYSTDWAQGGPIIDREKLSPSPVGNEGFWRCYSFGTNGENNGVWQCGPSPLIAAMRCYVVSKLGEEVEVPDELT